VQPTGHIRSAVCRRRGAPVAACLAAVLAAALLAGTARGSDAVQGSRVRDLYYGEALFYFYQDDHFDALTHLLAARAAGRVPNHEAESELLLGGLYLHYGQHVRAEAIFARLLTGDQPPEVRDRAWFYLGKVRYQRGLHEQALAAFARISGALPESLGAELPMLESQANMALGRFDVAATLLDSWDGPDAWLPYARYNLGVALVRLDRLEEGARQLDRVGQSTPDTDELLDLRDKANLALGYAYLQRSLDGQARPVLERVRLQGPFSSKALLGVGWADAEGEDYRAALTPWLELKGRDLLDSAVQESLLAIPYAYGRLDAHGSAAEGYEAALAAFDAEIGHLDNAIATAGNGSLIPAVLEADDTDLGSWYWELDKLPDTLEARYLYHLIADHDFQEGLRNLRDLMTLSAHLDQWQQKLGAFEEMVDTRQAAQVQRSPAFARGLDQADLAALRARRDAAAARLDAIETTRDIAGLGTAAELDQWQRLAAIGRDPGLAAPDAAGLRDRYRLLKGVLAWDLDREYQYRLWQQRRNLAELDTALAKAEAGHAGATAARGSAPRDLAGFAERIAAVGPRIARMQQAIAGARGDQEQQLTALALDTLREQRERLTTYRVQAQFALATIYDRAATAARVAPAQPRGAAP
jgi:hypothetical protein